MKEKEKYSWRESKFKRQIRIRENQYEYIESVRGRYSRAGMLDAIINYYKEHGPDSIQDPK